MEFENYATRTYRESWQARRRRRCRAWWTWRRVSAERRRKTRCDKSANTTRSRRRPNRRSLRPIVREFARVLRPPACVFRSALLPAPQRVTVNSIRTFTCRKYSYQHKHLSVTSYNVCRDYVLILTVFVLYIMIFRLYILLVSYFLLTCIRDYSATLAAKLSINLTWLDLTIRKPYKRDTGAFVSSLKVNVL